MLDQCLGGSNMNQSVHLAYGREGRTFDMPAHAELTLLRKSVAAMRGDPQSRVLAALASPVDAAPIRKEARGARTACIVICDVTRPVPNGLLLRPIIDELVAGGVPLTGICILVATGLHRPNEGAELAELIGDPWVTAHVRIENHDARRDEDHTDLGQTEARKTPIILDRRLVEADVRIVTGLVEPHFMAGYSGGRKVIAPGVAHHTTIRTFHSARFMEHPAARTCNLAGNPLHEEQLAIVAALGRALAVNVVLSDERDLVHVNYGEVVASHAASVEVAAGLSEVSVPRRFSTVVTSAAGYPLDRTYYQTVKGMVTPLDILEPGGTLIIAADCGEGLGSPDYRAAQEQLLALGQDAFVSGLEAKALADVDEWQTEMQVKSTRRADVALYSEALGDDHSLTGVRRIDDVCDAVAQSIGRTGDNAVAVIPEGPYVVPFCRQT